MQRIPAPWIIAMIALLTFFPFLGAVHLFDWDEVNFAEIAREMLLLKDYFRIHLNFQPFYEKPPLFFWLQAASMHVFGVGELAARFPNVLCGIATLIFLYRAGSRLAGPAFGWTWTLVYYGSLLPNFYFRSGIIDPWFNLFIFLSLYHFILYAWNRQGQTGLTYNHTAAGSLVWSGVFMGLGILTKGPVAFLLFAITLGVYWTFLRFRRFFTLSHVLIFLFVAGAVTLVWYGTETVLHGPVFIREFFRRQYAIFSTHDAGQDGFPGFHFVVLFFGCLPASIFTLRALRPLPGIPDHLKDMRLWMLILLGVVFVLFSVVKSKIVHYSSLAYFPITFLAALVIRQILDKKLDFKPWMAWTGLAMASILSLAPLALPFLAAHPEWLKALFHRDKFAVANLDATVHWTGFEFLSGCLLLAASATGVILWRRSFANAGFLTWFLGTALALQCILWAYIGRAEAYSQRAAVEFCQSLEGRDCYVITYGYKSYVPYFYARVQPSSNPDSQDKSWILGGPVDKEVYVLSKITKAQELKERYPAFREIGRKNGFVFFHRPAVSPDDIPGKD